MRTFLLLFIFGAAALGQAPPSTPSLQEILSRLAAMNQARAAALLAYHGTRTYQVTYKGFPKDLSAKAVVRIDYAAPDNKRFTIESQEGSSFLVNRVIRKALDSEQEAARPEFVKRSALDESNYQFQLVGEDSEAGRPCYLIEVTPRREDKYLYEGRICVDTVDYAVARIDAKPDKNPSFWISRAHIDSHSRKDGEFWFPVSIHSTSHVRLGGDAVLDIQYTDHQITSAKPLSSEPASSPASP